MDYSIHSDPDICRIVFSGKFGFSDSANIRKLIGSLADHKGKEVVLDLTDLEAIDSAGLGMIILLNDAAQEKELRIRLTGAGGQVRKMLDISNFAELMAID